MPAFDNHYFLQSVMNAATKRIQRRLRYDHVNPHLLFRMHILRNIQSLFG